MVITHPLLRVVDDSGAIVTGPTVAITSVKDKAGTDIASHGATVNISGANVSVDYDAEAKGEAWIVLAISKVASTFTGTRAAPAFYLARDSSRILSGITAAGQVDVGKVAGVVAKANNGAIVSASSNGVVLDAADPLVVASSNLSGYKVRLTGKATYAVITDIGTTATRVVAAWVNGTPPSGGEPYVLEAPGVVAPTGLNLVPGFKGWNLAQSIRAVASMVVGKRAGVPAAGSGGTVTFTDASAGDYGSVVVDASGNITTNSMTPPA